MEISASAKGSNTVSPSKTDSQVTAVVILGMHRSGTSALARVLSLLGGDLPKTLMQANATNEAGHWESAAIAKLNDRILESAGSSWHDWTEFNPGWFESPRAEQFRSDAIQVVQDEFGPSRLFIFKDPRLCRLLPFWLDVFHRCGVRPVALLPIRNPLEVAASLERRNRFEPGLGHLLWLRHVLDAEWASREMPRLFTTYDQLMESWGRIAENTQTTYGIRWPRVSDRTSVEIDDFLVGRLRHHQKPPESVLENRSVAGWIRETYAIMQRWASSVENVTDRNALDRIRQQLNDASPAFSRLISTGQVARQTAATLEQSLSEEMRKLQDAQASLADNVKTAQKAEEGLASERERASRQMQKLQDCGQSWLRRKPH